MLIPSRLVATLVDGDPQGRAFTVGITHGKDAVAVALTQIGITRDAVLHGLALVQQGKATGERGKGDPVNDG